MKAVAIRQFGGRDQMDILDVASPDTLTGEVLIRVRAAGVNPVDWMVREGRLKDAFPHEFPLILGWDAAGVVEKVGPGVTAFEKGDEVYAYCRKPVVQAGAYAEYIVLSEQAVARKPRSLSFVQAGGVPLAGLTAYQMLEAAGLKPGETVLVHAAAGGVGGFAVGLARARGARVLGTARAERRDYVRSLGADEVIDANAGDFRDAVRALGGADVVLDTVGGDTQQRSADVMRAGGRLVSISTRPDAARFTALGLSGVYVFCQPSGAQLGEIARLFDAGQLVPPQITELPVREFRRAHELSESGHTQGKIVLNIDF